MMMTLSAYILSLSISMMERSISNLHTNIYQYAKHNGELLLRQGYLQLQPCLALPIAAAALLHLRLVTTV